MTAKFIDLDTYVKRNNLPRVDYIKLDIEGAELEMLHGAAKTITRCKPKMAISAYHKPEDLWTLATYIKSLRADYEFEFRHYRIDCADYMLNDNERAALRYFEMSYLVPTGCEKVLYCK
ncbi:MAG: FkbM family methyltransferase [Selenomonadaceae bacterium]|nr:FkbM family methyltransferase [Selenomonadaceae bacterium]